MEMNVILFMCASVDSCVSVELVALCRLVSRVHRMTSLRPLVFSGPSGSGKSTLVQRLTKEHDGCFAFCVSRKSSVVMMLTLISCSSVL